MGINNQNNDELISVHIPDDLSKDMLKKGGKGYADIKNIFEIVGDMKDDIAKKIEENNDKKKN